MSSITHLKKLPQTQIIYQLYIISVSHDVSKNKLRKQLAAELRAVRQRLEEERQMRRKVDAQEIEERRG
eukprot:12927757-Prorocentrum_lima.AAC.1